MLQVHEEAFEDPDFCGIRPEDYPAEQLDRDHAWENSRIYRKAGGTSVPLGIFRNAAGEFIPLFGDSTAEDIRKALGI